MSTPAILTTVVGSYPIPVWLAAFWMLSRSVADRKMAALVAGRDKFLGTR